MTMVIFSWLDIPGDVVGSVDLCGMRKPRQKKQVGLTDFFGLASSCLITTILR
jgi:hypothetical protein